MYAFRRFQCGVIGFAAGLMIPQAGASGQTAPLDQAVPTETGGDPPAVAPPEALPEWAAAVEVSKVQAVDFLLGASLVVTVIVLAVVGVYFTRHVIHRAERARQRADMATALLDTAPAAPLTWDREGRFVASPRLIQWLGLSRPPVAFADLLDASGERGFAGADFARLEEAVLALRARGGAVVPFEVTAAGRRFRVSGNTIGNGGLPEMRVLWLEEVTDETERLVAETRRVQSLLAEKVALERMLDAFDFPVWRRGAGLGLEWVNEAYVQAVEAETRTDVIEQGIELVSNAISGRGRDHAARAQASGRCEHAKHFVVVHGQRRAIHVTDQPLLADGVAMGGVVGYARDVTDLDEVRSELARYTESHAETLNKLSTAVAIFDADRTLDFYNSAFIRLWGLPEDLLSARPHHNELLEVMREKRLLPEQADFPAWKRQHLAYYTELLEPLEEMWHLPDSSTLRVVSQPHPLGGLLIFFEDVTDRLALERSYNTLIAVQRATLNNLHEGVAVFGSDGLLRLYNPAFSEIWDIDEDVLAAEPHMTDVLARCEPLFDGSDALHRFRDQVFSEDAERVVKGGRLSRADGSEIDYTAVPLPDGATLLTYLDVTDSIRIERALRERNDALETADRLKTEFVAHMSYELRTPLNSVIGFAELLDKEYYGPLNAQQHNYTRNILESSQQLMLLINDILDLSVIEAGGMMLELRPVDIGSVLKSVATMVREDVRHNEQVLKVEVDEDLEPIEADERRLKQAIYNLLSNAMQFTPPKGVITLSGQADGGDLVISVADTGVGIAAEEQREVFERFNRGSNAQKGPGMGLGLSLVKSFIELHGGEVSLESAPDTGTCVLCRMPRQQARQKTPGKIAPTRKTVADQTSVAPVN